MDEKKLAQERIRAKAQWELLKLQQRAGKTTAEQVEEAHRVWQRIGAHQVQTSPRHQAPVATEKPYVPGQKQVVVAKAEPTLVLSEEMTALIVQLEKEREAVDVEKRGVSMQLQQVPASVPCPELVDRIMQLRKQWEEIGDRIWYVKRHGQLPEVQPSEDAPLPVEFSEQLPMDKYVLDRMIKNLRINVEHKWPGRLATAKTVSKKAEYERKIARGAAQLEVMMGLFGTL